MVKERKSLARRYEIGKFEDEMMWGDEEGGLKEENELLGASEVGSGMKRDKKKKKRQKG